MANKPLFIVGNSNRELAYFDGDAWSQLAQLTGWSFGTRTIRSIHGVSPNDFWIGMAQSTNNSVQFYHYKDGSWDTQLNTGGYQATDVSVHMLSTTHGYATTHDQGGWYGVTWRIRYSGGWFLDFLESYWRGGLLPCSISTTMSYFTGTNTQGYNGYPSGVMFYRWNGSMQRHSSGKGLPVDTTFWGVTTLGSDVFVLRYDGTVYKGTWEGTWTTETISGFSSLSSSKTAFTYRAISSDGTYLHAVDAAGVVYVRDTDGTWSSLGDAGATGTHGELSGFQVSDCVHSATTQCRYYDYGSSAWTNVPNGNLRGALALDSGEALPSGGDLAGGPRFRVGWDPSRRSGPRQEDGSMQGDLLIATGVQNIAQFDGGTIED